LVALTEFVGGICSCSASSPARRARAGHLHDRCRALHVGKGFFWTAGGLEYSLLILFVGLVFLIRGGGEYSLDRKLGREL
jgi:putative oxidoreductase